MAEVEGVNLGHVAPLEADTVPDINQSHYCFACEEPMAGLYCVACGNKNDDMRRSIWSLGAELFSSLTALEGRIWKSLRSLILKPGEMAREFSDGARTKWTSPIRLYLAMSLALFGYVTLSQTQLVAFGTERDPSSIVQGSIGGTDLQPTVYFLERKSAIRELVSDEDISVLEKNFQDMDSSLKEDSNAGLLASLESSRIGLAGLDAEISNSPSRYAVTGLKAGRQVVQSRISAIEAEITRRKNQTTTAQPIQANDEDSITVLSPESSAVNDFLDGFVQAASDRAGTSDANTTDKDPENKDNKEDSHMSISDSNGNKVAFDSATLHETASIVLRHPERVNAPLNKFLPRIMFIMMPFSMLLGAIFIRGREKAMLYDHLVHAAYIHAFSFLLLLAFILLVQYTAMPYLLGVYMLILLIYLPLSAKRMFKRGWFKTIITSYGVGLIYTFIMFLILISLITYGAFGIAQEVAEARAAIS